MTAAPTALTCAELASRLRAVDPNVLLASRQLLRRIRHRCRTEVYPTLFLPGLDSQVIDRESLLQIVAPRELGLAFVGDVPATPILLQQPDRRLLPPTALLRYWRLLFRARVQLAVRQRLAGCSAAELRRFWERLGPGARDEIELILRQEKHLPEDDDARLALVEFTALYLELRHFVPAHLPLWFPAQAGEPAVEGLLAELVDGTAIFAATRLADAPLDPAGRGVGAGTLSPLSPVLRGRGVGGEGRSTPEETSALISGEVPLTPNPSPRYSGARGEGKIDPSARSTREREEGKTTPLLDYGERGEVQVSPEAREKKGKGRRSRKGKKRRKGPSPATPHPHGARKDVVPEADACAAVGNVVRAALLRAGAGVDPEPDLARLTQRLASALPGISAECWLESLRPLPALAVEGYWSPTARFLYDLQKVCTDSERELYHVNLVRWALSLGGCPLERPVPFVNRLTVLKHLRSARQRLDDLPLSEELHQRLAHLLDESREQFGDNLCSHCRPLVLQALAEAGLTPANLVETVSRDKLVEELLDQLIGAGYFNFGQVRDAVARNQLKLEDVEDPVEYLLEDRLLRLDRALAPRFQGVYHRAEVYLRWLQTFSSLAFATGLGSWLVRFVALPFGGAYVVLAGIHYLVKEANHFLPHDFHRDVHLIEPPELGVLLTGVLGLFLLLLLHVGWFRRLVWLGCLQTGRGLHAAFIDFPEWVRTRPSVRAVLDNAVVRWLRRSLVKPLLVALLVLLVFWLAGADGETGWLVSGLVLFAGVALVNTRFGRDLDESLNDALLHLWQRLSVEMVPALFRFVLAVFRWLMGQLERLLYTVDEWLRFRQGESTLMLGVKAVFGLVWSVIAYLIRLVINLIVEPSVNPIKHFPVVTIAGKLLLPLIPVVVALAGQVVSPPLAILAGTLFIMGAPGIFGFLAWELKENWKLYRSNRRPTLQPVLIGSHGETMVRLLRPGFHSGTVPTLYRKLRRAAAAGNARRVYQLQHDLHHVEEALRHFSQRELTNLLESSGRWQAGPVRASDLRLSPGCIALALRCGEQPLLRLLFEHHSGWLLLRQEGPRWQNLRPQQVEALGLALRGLAHLAGVHLSDAWLHECLPAASTYEITAAGLTVQRDNEVGFYPWPDEGNLHGSEGWPVLPRARVRFDEQALPWEKWVRGWGLAV